MLSIRDLNKTYPGGVRALRGVSLDIPPGMFGLIGWAGIDPYNKLIDRNPEDNLVAVERK